MYESEKLTPNQISLKLGVNHKTIRSHLKRHGIKMRDSTEYNYLPRKTHDVPSQEDLFSNISIMAHTAYWCEGWHTHKTSFLLFCNTNPKLIDLFVTCLTKVYRVKHISYRIILCCEEDLAHFEKHYPEAKFSIDENKKCPLVEVKAGGVHLADLFVSNAKFILERIAK